jgi:hypothetical protein
MQLRKTLADGLNKHIFTPADGFRRIEPAELSADAVDELLSTIEELLLSYRDNDPHQILAFMRARGQELIPTMRKNVIAHANDTNTSPPPSSPEEAWCDYWRYWGYNPHWSGVVDGGTVIEFFEVREDGRRALMTPATLATDEHKLWKNTKSIGKQFQPSNGFTHVDALDKQGKVLLADVRLVIEHSKAIYGQRSPYYIRMWRNETAMRWEPVRMSRARIDLTRQEGIKLAF